MEPRDGAFLDTESIWSNAEKRNAWPQVSNSHKFISECKLIWENKQHSRDKASDLLNCSCHDLHL